MTPVPPRTTIPTHVPPPPPANIQLVANSGITPLSLYVAPGNCNVTQYGIYGVAMGLCYPCPSGGMCDGTHYVAVLPG